MTWGHFCTLVTTELHRTQVQPYMHGVMNLRFLQSCPLQAEGNSGHPALPCRYPWPFQACPGPAHGDGHSDLFSLRLPLLTPTFMLLELGARAPVPGALSCARRALLCLARTPVSAPVSGERSCARCTLLCPASSCQTTSVRGTCAGVTCLCVNSSTLMGPFC